MCAQKQNLKGKSILISPVKHGDVNAIQLSEIVIELKARKTSVSILCIKKGCPFGQPSEFDDFFLVWFCHRIGLKCCCGLRK